ARLGAARRRKQVQGLSGVRPRQTRPHRTAGSWRSGRLQEYQDSRTPDAVAGRAPEGALEPAPYMTWSLPFAAGAICATAADLITWQQALENGRVISPAGLAQMRTPSRLNDGTTIDYGLGTRMGTLEGHRVVGHT